jgi:hypothetical protein
MRISDFKISTRTLVAFGLIMALFLGVGTSSYFQMQRLQSNVLEFGTNLLPGTKSLGRMMYYETRARSVGGGVAAREKSERFGPVTTGFGRIQREI